MLYGDGIKGASLFIFHSMGKAFNILLLNVIFTVFFVDNIHQMKSIPSYSQYAKSSCHMKVLTFTKKILYLFRLS